MEKPLGTPHVTFGVQLPVWDYNVHEEVSFERILETALLAEELGYDVASVDDHLMRGEASTFFESMTTLGLLVAATSRIRFLTTVLCNMYRHPALLAKMAATLDAASGGRLEIGVGAGWKQEEARAYGIPWAGTKERMDRLEEGVQVMKALWTQQRASFAGVHYSLDGAECAPKPVQRPHIPLWIGGGGELRTLKIAAAHADGADFAAPGIGSGAGMDHFEYFSHKKNVLERHCLAVGRDAGELKLSAGINLMFWGRDQEAVRSRLEEIARKRSLSPPERERLLAGMRDGVDTVSEAVDHVRRFIDLGATYICVTRANREGIQRFANEVVPRL